MTDLINWEEKALGWQRMLDLEEYVRDYLELAECALEFVASFDDTTEGPLTDSEIALALAEYSYALWLKEVLCRI